MTLVPGDAAGIEHEFLAYAVAQSHPLARELAADRLDQNLLAILHRDIERIGSATFATWFAAGRESPELPAARFNNRFIDAEGVRLIAGIRFRNRDPNFPFVGIERSSAPIGAIVDAGALIARLQREFAEFQPRAVSFHHPSHLPLRIARARCDRHILIASARSMTGRPKPPGYERVQLVPSAGLQNYDRYAAAYADIFRERPELRAVIRVETRETLQDCLAQSLLFDILVDGAWSGLIAGCADVLAGVDGTLVVDIVLSKAARGARLGVVVQRHFAEALMSRDSAAVILGTIDEANVAMLRTAAAAGRIDVGATYWIDL